MPTFSLSCRIEAEGISAITHTTPVWLIQFKCTKCNEEQDKPSGLDTDDMVDIGGTDAGLSAFHTSFITLIKPRRLSGRSAFGPKMFVLRIFVQCFDHFLSSLVSGEWCRRATDSRSA